MNTDREMLELAAKAADIPMKPDFAEKYDYYMADPLMWNPRVDDGDNRRLQVKLRMTVQTTDKEATAYCDELPNGTNWVTVQITESIDDCAATRLAVLRCAAEIGRAMP